ncbi:MAG TPA: hypothetical protein VNI01_09145 [Elusimicrobiota bacterium]|jgi:hypothetical protein|nr:hypothetical protein [Elusimicrobiota bacterium]
MNIIVAGIAGFNGAAGAEDARFHFATVLTCIGAMMIVAAIYHLIRAPESTE